MHTRLISLGRLSAILPFLLFALASCKKDDTNKSMANCQQAGAGINGTNERDVVFWTRKDFGCGNPEFIDIISLEGGAIRKTFNNYITQQYPTQPACDAIGAIRVRVIYGHEYEYTIACTGHQWKGKVRVDCSSDDCVFVELK